jgi:hypothetical protein
MEAVLDRENLRKALAQLKRRADRSYGRGYTAKS